jgi:hypothetical protein
MQAHRNLHARQNGHPEQAVEGFSVWMIHRSFNPYNQDIVAQNMSHFYPGLTR